MLHTSVYAALLGLLFLFLSYRVIEARRDARVGLGDGGQKSLQRHIRVHANLAEYAPLALLLLLLAELQGAPWWLVHVIGLALLAGRIMHAYGVGRDPELLDMRVRGMALTLGAIALAILANLAVPLYHLWSI